MQITETRITLGQLNYRILVSTLVVAANASLSRTN